MPRGKMKCLTLLVCLIRYHQVRSYDRNIAVNVWWKHKADFIPTDCDMEPNQTLDKFKFSALEKESSNEEPVDLMWVMPYFAKKDFSLLMHWVLCISCNVLVRRILKVHRDKIV